MSKKIKEEFKSFAYDYKDYVNDLTKYTDVLQQYHRVTVKNLLDSESAALVVDSGYAAMKANLEFSSEMFEKFSEMNSQFTSGTNKKV